MWLVAAANRTPCRAVRGPRNMADGFVCHRNHGCRNNVCQRRLQSCCSLKPPAQRRAVHLTSPQPEHSSRCILHSICQHPFDRGSQTHCCPLAWARIHLTRRRQHERGCVGRGGRAIVAAKCVTVCGRGRRSICCLCAPDLPCSWVAGALVGRQGWLRGAVLLVSRGADGMLPRLAHSTTWVGASGCRDAARGSLWAAFSHSEGLLLVQS
jgi:hypothetical protein